MSRNLPRKRHVQPQVDDNRTQSTTATLLNGKHVRWLQKGLFRRIRLLFSLLRRYPVVLLLFLIIWVGTRLLSNRNHTSFPSEPGNLKFQHEITIPSGVLFLDNELAEDFEQRKIQRLSNFRSTSQGVFLDVQLEGAKKGIAKVVTHENSQNVSHSDRVPRLHQLAKLLHLHHGFMRSYRIRLPIALQEPLADRHVAKAFCRACGFRSPTKVEDGATVAAYVVPIQPDLLRFFSALRTPTVEPYDWASNFPTSHECSRGVYDQRYNSTEQKICRRLTEVMIVMYLAGCAPPSNDAFVQLDADISGDHGMFKVAFPFGCFGHYEDNSVLLDIALAFVGKTCSLPSGLLGLVKRLVGIGWGVGRRAIILEKRLDLLNYDHDGICRNRGWTFYEGSINI